MSRTYTDAVNEAIRERASLRITLWKMALEPGEVRRIAIDGFEFTVQADSRRNPTLDRSRVVSDEIVGRLYMPGWSDPVNPAVWSYIYVSTSTNEPMSLGLGTSVSSVLTPFDNTASYVYSKEGGSGGAWLGNMQVLAVADPSESTLIEEFGRKGDNNSMWLSLLLALITFLMSSDGTKEGRRKALLTAGAVGLGSAYVTSQTEWGQEINGNFNEAFGLEDSWSGFPSDTEGSPSSPTTGATIPTVKPTAQPGGVFSNLPSWVSTAGAGVAGVAIGSSLPAWVWWAGGGLLVYLLIKD